MTTKIYSNSGFSIQHGQVVKRGSEYEQTSELENVEI